MAFGHSPAPRIFTKLVNVVTEILRRQGLRLVIVLDDFLLLNSLEGGGGTLGSFISAKCWNFPIYFVVLFLYVKS
jgi:hypothetical protein